MCPTETRQKYLLLLSIPGNLEIPHYMCRRCRRRSFRYIKWLQQNGCDWDKNTCEKAAKNRHLDILIWARENGCDWNYLTCENLHKSDKQRLLIKQLQFWRMSTVTFAINNKKIFGTVKRTLFYFYSNI